MHDPIRMVIVDIAASLLLLLGLFLYKKLYPAKKINLLILLIIISFLPLLGSLRPGDYESGDFTYHVKFALQFFANLQQGNFFPSWVEKQCSGYGCPDFIFTYQLSQYLTSLIHLFGFSFIVSSKILIAIAYIISGVGMFLWIKNNFSERSAFAASVFYLFAPYHLIDLNFRTAVAELLSIAILPFLFLTTQKLIQTTRTKYFLLTSILFSMLILSHQVASIASLPLLILYSIFVWFTDNHRSFKKIIFVSLSYLWGLLLSAFYWLPAIFESKYTLYSKPGDIAFTPLSDLFFSPNKLGLLFQGHFGELYPSIGYTQWFMILVAFFAFTKIKKNKKEKALLFGCLIIFAMLFFMIQPYSKPVWDLVPFLKNFQFSYRLSIQAIITISVITAIVFKYIPNTKFFILICFITIAYTLLNWNNRGALPKVTDQYLERQMIFYDHPNQLYVLTPIWVGTTKPWIAKIPQTHIQVLNGSAQIKQISRSITHHEYILNISQKATFKENTYYFPGWELMVNNEKKDINYKNPDYPGIITFTLSPGLYKIDLIFKDTPIRKSSRLISFLSGLAILALFLKNIFLPKRKVLIR